MNPTKSEQIDALGSPDLVSRRKFAKRAILGTLGSSILLKSRLGNLGEASRLPGIEQGTDLPARNITVERVETFKVVVPMKPGTVLSENYERVPEIRASWDFDSIPKFVIRLHSSSGLVGLGETARGESELALAQNCKFLTGRNILGLDFENPALALPQVSTSDAFEIAIFDLIGKTLGAPVHVLLGGRFQDKIAVTYWTGQRNETDLVNIARNASELGFKHLKFKAQNYDPVAQLVRAVDKATPHLEESISTHHMPTSPASSPLPSAWRALTCLSRIQFREGSTGSGSYVGGSIFLLPLRRKAPLM